MKPLHVKLMHDLHETYLPTGTLGTLGQDDGSPVFIPDQLPADWPFEKPFWYYNKITYKVLLDEQEATCPSK